MMSELTRLKDEAARLLTIYEEYKDSSDEFTRRKVHLDLDRFLMEHREVAALLMVQGLQDAFDQLAATGGSAPQRPPWYKRILGGSKHGYYKIKKRQEAVRAE